MITFYNTLARSREISNIDCKYCCEEDLFSMLAIWRFCCHGEAPYSVLTGRHKSDFSLLSEELVASSWGAAKLRSTTSSLGSRTVADRVWSSIKWRDSHISATKSLEAAIWTAGLPVVYLIPIYWNIFFQHQKKSQKYLEQLISSQFKYHFGLIGAGSCAKRIFGFCMNESRYFGHCLVLN